MRRGDSLGGVARGDGSAQTPAAASAPAPAPAPAAAAAAPLTAADLTSIKTPSADDRAKGDPDGGADRQRRDVTVSDSKAGLTIADLANQVGQNKIAINFMWTLICRLPRHVHAGRLRDRRDGPDPGEEREPHHDDELHGVRRRHAGLLADRLRDPDGRRRRGRQPGRHAAAERRTHDPPVREGPRHLRQQRLPADAPRHVRRRASWWCSCSRWSSWTRP